MFTSTRAEANNHMSGRVFTSKSTEHVHSVSADACYGLHQEEMWQHYRKRLQEAGASREPGPAPFEQRPKSK